MSLLYLCLCLLTILYQSLLSIPTNCSNYTVAYTEWLYKRVTVVAELDIPRKIYFPINFALIFLK